MKTFIYSTNKVIRIASIIIVILSLSTFSFAVGNGEDILDKPVKVQYLGTINSEPVFSVQVANIEGADLILTIENTAGDLLYKKEIKETSFSKKIQLQTNETEISLNIYVYSSITKTKELYQVNKQTKQVDDVVINYISKL